MLVASLWSEVEDAVAPVVDAVEAWASALSAIDFVFVVVIVWAIYWIWASVTSTTRLGAVEVAPVEHDAPDLVLTSLLRERLAKGGLTPPPQVPSGAPQANLIAAVESSGHPQAQWMAKALSLVPSPPRPVDYKLAVTVFSAPATAKRNQTFGARYWLQPATTGQAQLETVQGLPSAEAAICRVAAEVVLDMSRNAGHAFPQWSLWTETEAFLTYMKGVYCLRDHHPRDARDAFEAAHAAEPSNLLVRLQLANLSEHAAAGRSQKTQRWGWAPSDRVLVKLARKQAEIARSYLDIGVARSDLVSARYRAGIALGRLAGDCRLLKAEADRRALCEIVGIPVDDDPSPALYELAEDELEAAFLLTARFHVLAHGRRLRHRYEPTGRERLQLRRTIAVARKALAVPQLTPDDETWQTELKVRWWHLGVMRLTAGWNAHYNAGCVFALLHARQLRLEPHQDGVDPIDSDASRALRRRAYEYLGTAIDKAGGELQPGWLAWDDPALRSLRYVNEPEWNVLVRRVSGSSRLEGQPMPQSAQGDPRRRRFQTRCVAGVLAALSLTVLLFDRDELGITLALALPSIIGLLWFLKERRLTAQAGVLDQQSILLRKAEPNPARTPQPAAAVADPGRTSPVS
ncbi:hypothetical protein OJ997_15320 [Solirubrobacter phytolaccae]|uniref:Uncharacterized protein n=1 Tax=Solirubrobacter phytolaccae TaxID=1404360 RepID=A0A9X3N824_9ACTN|nr:hypothetical protein [Solirubrobacter phytolaccae]MDA0181675.1 hypothetical protein [Solirubrobacter phytolaccae]